MPSVPKPQSRPAASLADIFRPSQWERIPGYLRSRHHAAAIILDDLSQVNQLTSYAASFADISYRLAPSLSSAPPRCRLPHRCRSVAIAWMPRRLLHIRIANERERLRGLYQCE